MQNRVCRHVLLVCKAHHERARELGCEILQWLRIHGHMATLIEAGKDEAAYDEELDFVIVLGGDGTVLHTVHLLHDRQAPILPVNFGHMGFLANTDA